MIYLHKMVLTLILIMLTAALPVGCASPAATLPTTAPATAATTASTTTASQKLNCAHVRLPGFWSSPKLGRFVWDKDWGEIVN